MKPRTVRLAFYKAEYGKIFWDKLIAWWTKGKYSHVELVFNDKHWFTSTTHDGAGTRFKKRKNYQAEHWVFFDVEISYDQAKELWDWCKEQEGVKYDLMGVFGFISGSGLEDSSKWYCSEVCGTGLMVADVYNFSPKLNPTQMFKIVEANPDLFKPRRRLNA